MRNSSGKEHPVGLDARHRQVMGGSRGRQRVELSGRDTVWTLTEDARKRERCHEAAYLKLTLFINVTLINLKIKIMLFGELLFVVLLLMCKNVKNSFNFL